MGPYAPNDTYNQIQSAHNSTATTGYYANEPRPPDPDPGNRRERRARKARKRRGIG